VESFDGSVSGKMELLSGNLLGCIDKTTANFRIAGILSEVRTEIL
jgi:hypothetical protein